MMNLTLGAISIDCDDVHELIAFYSRVTGIEIGFESDAFAAINLGSLWLSVQHVENHQAPSWPTSASPKQLHLDFSVDDLDEGEVHVLAAGAIKTESQPNPDGWRVYVDPAGHPFCLTKLIPS